MPTNTSESGIPTIKEVAEYLKVYGADDLPARGGQEDSGLQVGGMWRFRTADIDGWIAAQSQKAEGKD